MVIRSRNNSATGKAPQSKLTVADPYQPVAGFAAAADDPLDWKALLSRISTAAADPLSLLSAISDQPSDGCTPANQSLASQTHYPLPRTMDQPTLLTLAETAAVLGMSVKSVQRRIRAGVIRKAPLGGRLVRISIAELRRLAAGGFISADPDCPDLTQSFEVLGEE